MIGPPAELGWRGNNTEARLSLEVAAPLAKTKISVLKWQ
jgi:hypothetical protein